jgi:hypothetical protein
MASSSKIAGMTITHTGRLLRTAAIFDEPWQKCAAVENLVSKLSQEKWKGLAADIFTFSQKVTSPVPAHPYRYEWDNAAVVSTERFDDWWEKLPQESRKNVRRAAKKGVSVNVVKFDDQLVHGIKSIYDEAPLRQGRRFWHYGKDFDTVKRENGTYLERSEFIGAYHEGDLIGFLKFVRVDRTAEIMQILAKTQHQDKRPMNALIAKAVEVCAQSGLQNLIYSKFNFGNKKKSPLTEFKRRNGFVEIRFPRFYVPLTVKGRTALALGLHRGMLETLPSWLIDPLLGLRFRAWNAVYGVLGSRD